MLGGAPGCPTIFFFNGEQGVSVKFEDEWTHPHVLLAKFLGTWKISAHSLLNVLL